MKLLYDGSTLLTLMFASGCGKCVVGVYGNLDGSVLHRRSWRENRYAREHHVKRYAQFLGDVSRCKTWRVRNDGVRNERCLVSHYKRVSLVSSSDLSYSLILAFM